MNNGDVLCGRQGSQLPASSILNLILHTSAAARSRFDTRLQTDWVKSLHLHAQKPGCYSVQPPCRNMWLFWPSEAPLTEFRLKNKTQANLNSNFALQSKRDVAGQISNLSHLFSWLKGLGLGAVACTRDGYRAWPSHFFYNFFFPSFTFLVWLVTWEMYASSASYSWLSSSTRPKLYQLSFPSTSPTRRRARLILTDMTISQSRCSAQALVSKGDQRDGTVPLTMS